MNKQRPANNAATLRSERTKKILNAMKEIFILNQKTNQYTLTIIDAGLNLKTKRLE